jgi:hypothetical protein
VVLAVGLLEGEHLAGCLLLAQVGVLEGAHLAFVGSYAGLQIDGFGGCAVAGGFGEGLGEDAGVGVRGGFGVGVGIGVFVVGLEVGVSDEHSNTNY